MSDNENTQSPSKNESSDGSSSDGKVQNFGAWLRQQRETRGISLEEIAAVTKIHIQQLENLEANKIEELPSTAFVRGFLVNYSRHLELDEDEVLSLFRELSGREASMAKFGARAAVPTQQSRTKIVDIPVLKRNPTGTAPRDPTEKSKFELKHFGLLLIVVATFGVLTYLVSLGKSIQQEGQAEGAVTTEANDEAPPAPDSDLLVGPQPAPEEVDAKSKEPVEAKKTAQATPEPKPQVKPPVETPPAKPEAQTPPPPKPPVAVKPPPVEKPKPAPVVAARGDSTLEIRGLDTSWVNVRVDAKGAEGFELESGKTAKFSVKQKAIVSLSNSGVVEILWNGKWYSAPGFRGEVKSITLPNQLGSLKAK